MATERSPKGTTRDSPLQSDASANPEEQPPMQQTEERPAWMDAPGGDLRYLWDRGTMRTNQDAAACSHCGGRYGTLVHDPYRQTYQHYPTCQNLGPQEMMVPPREQAIPSAGEGPELLPGPGEVGLTPP